MSKILLTVFMLCFYFRSFNLVHFLFIPQLYYDIKHTGLFVYYIFLDNHTIHFKALKICLTDYYEYLKELTNLLKANDNTGIKTRIVLLENGGPQFLNLYNSENLLTGNSNWTYKVEEIAPLMKLVEDEYSKIVNDFDTPVTTTVKSLW